MKLLFVDDARGIERLARKILSTLGEVSFVSPEDAIPALISRVYDLVVVNGEVVDYLDLFVARIHYQKLCPRVVVVVSDPSWQLVRDVFQAGASDCLRGDAPPAAWRDVVQDPIKLLPDFIFETAGEDHGQSHYTSG